MNRSMILTALCLGSALASCSTIDAPPVAAMAAAPAGEIGDMVLARYENDAPGGAVLVARGDTVLFRGARGEADRAGGVALRPDTRFRIGSVSKQFAAAGLLKLVEAGKVRLDDPLSRFLPDYPGGDAITILELLNHTSGVPNYTAIPGYMSGPVQRDLSTGQMIDVFAHQPPAFAPGSKWAYSNSGYVLVGAVIEAASGMAWHDYLKRALFVPLGMDSTGYALDPAMQRNQAKGYTYQGDTVVAAAPISMTQPHAAGALVSNIDDLFKWNRALHEGRVLDSALYAKMITPVGPAADPAIGYGLGIFTGQLRSATVLSHGGGIFGFVAALLYVPGKDVSVVVLENDDQDNDEKGGESADGFARRLAAIALDDPYPAMRPVTVESAALERLEGVYVFDGEVRRILRVVDGTLTAQRGSRGEAQLLVSIGGDEFLYPDGFGRLRIERTPDGAVAALRFFANGDGPGEVGINRDEPMPGAASPPPAAPRAALERLVGTYRHQGMALHVFFQGDELVSQIEGQPAVTLRATSATSFDVEETGATLEFPVGELPAESAIIRQNGRELKLIRGK